MSAVKRHEAHLPFHSGPHFPPSINMLNNMLANHQFTELELRAELDAIARGAGGYKGMDHIRPTTSDDHTWLAGLRFTDSEEVVILVPRSQDWSKQDGTSANRSIAAYGKLGQTDAIIRVVESFAEAWVRYLASKVDELNINDFFK